MGKRGPKRTPTSALQLSGSWRGDARDRTEPQPGTAIPRCPSTLDKLGRATWASLIPIVTNMRVMTEADGHALALLCEAWSRYVRITNKLRTTNDLMPIRTADGTVIGYNANPLWRMQLDAEAAVRRGLDEFGLSPASRAGVTMSGVPLPGGKTADGPQRQTDDDFSRTAFMARARGVG